MRMEHMEGEKEEEKENCLLYRTSVLTACIVDLQ